MAISKIILNGVTQMDVTQDTVASANLLSGETATGADGNQVVGAYVPASAPTGNINITHSGQTDVTNYATATVPNADVITWYDPYYTTVGGSRKWRLDTGYVRNDGDEGNGWLSSDDTETHTYDAVPANTTVTPSTSAQTIGGANYMMEGAVTVEAMPNGTAGTPTANKGTVSNHAISVTPSVTNTSGYITGSTKTGTAVSVSASELVSGNLAITENGTNIDVTNYATVSVAVEGGGGSGVQTDNVGVSVETPSSSITFTGLKGEPTSFIIIPDSNSISTASPPNVIALVFDGTTIHGQTASTTSNANASYDTGFTKSYSNGTLTITSTTARFGAEWWDCEYTYGGSSANIDTKDVQVGSGAISITFTGLDDEPILWSCIFKSNFGTSSGYQRVMFVRDNGNTVWGYCLDSSVHGSSAYWTSSYSNGSLTITSSGTNAGGYFHQPGYYQLTAVYGEPVETTIEPLTVTENGTYSEPGVAYSPVTVNVPSSGGVNVATVTWTNSSSTATSHTFTGLLGTPKAAFLRCTTSLSRSSSSSNYYVADMRWTGSATAGNSFRRSNGTYANVTSGYSFSASGTSLTVTTSGTSTSNPGSFYNGTYELTYVY